MASHGSPLFEAYARNLRRVYWVEFVDAQNHAVRPTQFRASLVEESLPDLENLTGSYDYHRYRARERD